MQVISPTRIVIYARLEFNYDDRSEVTPID
jgi:hypothetical protein